MKRFYFLLLTCQLFLLSGAKKKHAKILQENPICFLPDDIISHIARVSDETVLAKLSTVCKQLCKKTSRVLGYKDVYRKMQSSVNTLIMFHMHCLEELILQHSSQRETADLHDQRGVFEVEVNHIIYLMQQKKSFKKLLTKIGPSARLLNEKMQNIVTLLSEICENDSITYNRICEFRGYNKISRHIEKYAQLKISLHTLTKERFLKTLKNIEPKYPKKCTVKQSLFRAIQSLYQTILYPLEAEISMLENDSKELGKVKQEELAKQLQKQVKEWKGMRLALYKVIKKKPSSLTQKQMIAFLQQLNTLCQKLIKRKIHYGEQHIASMKQQISDINRIIMISFLKSNKIKAKKTLSRNIAKIEDDIQFHKNFLKKVRVKNLS